MPTNEQQTWVAYNQQYLSRALHEIKTCLLQHRAQIKGLEWQDVMGLSESTMPEMSTLPAIEQLTNTFQLSPFERNILLLCAGVELDAEISNLVLELQAEGSRMPTFGLALALFAETAHWSALSPEAPLRYWRLIDCGERDLLTRSPCQLDEQVLHFLTGVSYFAPQLGSVLRGVEPEVHALEAYPLATETLSQLCAYYSKQDTYPLFQLQGSSNEEKATLSAAVLAHFKVSVYALNPAHLPIHFQELADLNKLWNRSAAIQHLALFVDVSNWDILDATQKRNTLYFLENAQGVVLYGAEQKINDLKRTQLPIHLEKLSVEKQHTVWQQQLGPLAFVLNGELEQLSAQFNIDSGGIKKIAALVAAQDGTGVADPVHLKQQLWQACINHTRPDLEQLAQRIEPVATWDDLVLPEREKVVLQEIALHVRQRSKVYHEWGFAGKSMRGLGISALFAGESGTGKTMASEVIANELGLDLYRIDLSQVVNKYIGETEKNLKKIFDAAEGSGAILLFDEADALFGKRSEVKDSHDRYSNIEVSYLLQKMEEYRGLAILTTNMRNALDKAFLRRIRFVVQFPFPDASMRTEIWRRVFPTKTPQQALDFQKLSALSVAGGNIRNIALNAAFTAAGQNRPVNMHDIHLSACNEYLKLEKHMSASETLI